MRDRATFLRVGLFVLGGTALLIGLVLFLSGRRLSEGAKYETYFTESVQGLEVGAPVKYRGVTIGRVTEIGLVSSIYATNEPEDIQRATYRLVYVRFIIDPARVRILPTFALAERTGLRTRIASQGLTGLTYIELDFAKPDLYPPQPVPWTPRAEYIPSMPSTLAQVQDAAQQFLAKLNSVDVVALVNSITRLAQAAQKEIEGGDLHLALTHVNDLLLTLSQAVQDADVPKLTADLRATSGAVRAVAQGKDVRELLANLNAASDRLAAAAAKLPGVLAGLQATSERAGASTADIQQSLIPLLRDMQAVAANLRDTTAALRQYPAQVLLGGPPSRERSP